MRRLLRILVRLGILVVVFVLGMLADDHIVTTDRVGGEVLRRRLELRVGEDIAALSAHGDLPDLVFDGAYSISWSGAKFVLYEMNSERRCFGRVTFRTDGDSVSVRGCNDPAEPVRMLQVVATR